MLHLHLGVLLAYAVLTVVFAFVYRVARRSYLGWWELAFGLMVVSEAISLLRDVELLGVAFAPVTRLLMVGAGGLLLAGAYRFAERRFPRWLLVTLALVPVWIVVTAALGNLEVMRIGVYGFVSAALGATGAMLLRQPAPGVGRWVAGLGFVGLSVHSLAFSFLGGHPWYETIATELDLGMILTIALGVVVLHLDREHEALLWAAARTRQAFDSAVEGLFEVDASGKLLGANGAFEELIGRPALGTSLLDSELYRDAAEAGRVAGALATGQAFEELELTWLPDSRRVRLSARPVVSAGVVTGWEGAAHDITAQHRLRLALTRRGRMEELGQLAGGIAHDFNNALTAVLAGTEISLERLPRAHPARVDLDGVRESARRASRLTRQLLDFSRLRPAGQRTVDLRSTLEGVVSMLRRLVGEEVELVWTPPRQALFVRQAPGRIDDVVVSLALRARDAMPSGGRIELTLTELPAREMARVVMRDSGPSLTDEDLGRIFEPFSPGGAGLELASAYGIAQQLGGSLEATRAEDGGTAFVLELPLALEATGDHPVADMSQDLGPATIVLAEDERAVRRLVTRALERAGHKVLTAASGEEALALAREVRPELLITDVSMPGMGGVELATILSEERPGLGVMFLSGYTAEAVPEPLGRTATFLGKPFTLDALYGAVHRARRAP